MRTIVIGCDNAAVDLKNQLMAYMRSLGYTVENEGCDSSDDPTMYPAIAERVCKNIIDSGFSKRGVLVCGTGIGMAMTANKFKGIRAAVGHDIFSAERSILSNNGNVICFGARVIGPELAKHILGTWLPLEFKNGSSTPKVQNMIEIENMNMK